MRLNEVDLNSRADLTFRFRSADKMLEYQELENTEIYFCPFEEEDDVLEGELNLYWEADEILWDNFFAHYYMVFFFHYSMMILEDENKREIPREIYWCQFRSDYNQRRRINLGSMGAKFPKIPKIKFFVYFLKLSTSYRRKSPISYFCGFFNYFSLPSYHHLVLYYNYSRCIVVYLEM